jgi:hypothetical protein
VFVVELEDGHVEALAMHKFAAALSTMVGKEAALSLHLRYLTKEQQEDGQQFWEGVKNGEEPRDPASTKK